MKNTKVLKVLASSFMLGALALSASCGKKDDTQDNEKAVKRIIVEQDGILVNKDFEVPTQALQKEISWSSQDEASLKFKKDENGKMYAVVTRPTTGSKTVKFNAKIGEATREFSIKLNAVSAYEIATNYGFSQSGKIVYNDFNLDSTVEYKLSNLENTNYASKTAEITWTSNSNLIKIENGKAVVTPMDEKTPVELTAVFKLGEETSTKTYTVNVYKELNNEQKLQMYYDSVASGDTFTLTGYVLHKVWRQDKTMPLIYLLDQTKKGGYYVYNPSIKKEDYDKIKLGDRIQFTDVTNQNYNGLIETKQIGGYKLITDDKVLAPISAEELKHYTDGINIDNMLVSGDANIKLLTGTMVNVTGWKVSKVGTKDDTGHLIVELTNNSQKVQVIQSDYVTYEDPENKDIAGLYSSFAVGDIVNAHGILGNYNAWQIELTSKGSITKVTEEKTYADAVAVGKAKNNSNKDKTIPGFNASEKTIDLTKFYTGSDATVSFALEGTPKTAKIENGTSLVLTPTEIKQTVTVLVTYSHGDYSEVVRYKFINQIVDSETMLDYESGKIKDINAKYGTNVLVTTPDTYVDVVISYEVVEGADVARIVKDSKKNTCLAILPSATADQNIKVKATFTVNGQTKTKEFTKQIKKYTLTSLNDIPEATDNKTYTVEGIISKAEKPEGKTYTNYYISIDGTEGTRQFWIYSPKYWDQSQKMELKVGDRVTVNAQWKTFGQDKEFTNCIVLIHTPANAQ